jgi:NAD-dependent dihydropyrimidine dehydrogenase PreA subunit
MTYVITEPCVGTCDTACVQVCPVDCIHGPIDKNGAGAEVATLDTLEGKQLYIDPNECIDCGACEPECPVDAIYDEDDLPEEYQKYTEINANFFKE